MSQQRFSRYLVGIAIVVVFISSVLRAQVISSPVPISKPQAEQFLRSQAYFERNDGQIDRRVLYEVHGLQYSLFLTRTGATLALPSSSPTGKQPSTSNPSIVQLSFKGMSDSVEIEGVDKLTGYNNYFSGSNPQKWHTRVPQFARVRYRNVYPGIDVIFYVRDGQLEYDFAVSPGADPRQIRMTVEGATLSFSARGDVVLRQGKPELISLLKPDAKQLDGARAVASGYSIHDHEIGFTLGSYDRSKLLLIDPALAFSTFLTSGLSSLACDQVGDNVNNLAADSTGVYITGSTCADSFPLVAGKPAPTAASNRFFVTKIDPSGSQVLFTSFIAGGLDDSVEALAVDNSGAIYLAGQADAHSQIPITAGAYSGAVCQVGQGLGNTCSLPFAQKLSSDGATLLYSTFLQMASGPPAGSSSTQELVFIAKIAVDDQGALYVAGSTEATSFTNVLPLQVPVGAFQTTPGKLFALKLNPTGSALSYATYLDGASTGQSIVGIGVDSSHAAYIGGSALAGYPTTPGALLPTSTGGPFVTKLSADGTAQVYSTYVDPLGTGTSTPMALAVDPAGEAVIVGEALSTGAFVSKLNPAGSSLVYSKNLNGAPSPDALNNATSVAVDSTGAAYVGGYLADIGSFVLLNPIQDYVFLETPGMLVKLDTAGTLVWSTFLGEVEIEELVPQVAIDASGNVYFMDQMSAPGSTAGSINPQGPPSFTLIKVTPSLGAPVPIFTPGSISFSPTNVGTKSSSVASVLGNFGDASMSPTLSLTGPFSETDDCSSSSVPAGGKCDVQIVFVPTTSGPQTGTLTVTASGALTEAITLSGTGTSPAVSLSSATLSFPQQAVGITSLAQNLVITNSGTGSLSITSLQAAGDFSQTNGCGAPVAPGGTCTVQVTFTPTTMGSRTGTLTITDNAPGSPQTVSLSGTGGSANLGLTVPVGGSSSASVSAGGTASYTLLLGGEGMAGTATLSCSGAPQASTCNLPASMNFSSTTPATFSVSIGTTARQARLLPLRFGKPSPLWAVGLFGIVMLPLAVQAKRSSLKSLNLVYVFVAILLLASCGGGSNPNGGGTQGGNGGGGQTGTPAGTFTVTVTATSGSSTQSTNLTLTVQ